MCIKKELRYFFEKEKAFPSYTCWYDNTKRVIDFPRNIFEKLFPSISKKTKEKNVTTFVFENFQVTNLKNLSFITIIYKSKE